MYARVFVVICTAIFQNEFSFVAVGFSSVFFFFFLFFFCFCATRAEFMHTNCQIDRFFAVVVIVAEKSYHDVNISPNTRYIRSKWAIFFWCSCCCFYLNIHSTGVLHVPKQLLVWMLKFERQLTVAYGIMRFVCLVIICMFAYLFLFERFECCHRGQQRLLFTWQLE